VARANPGSTRRDVVRNVNASAKISRLRFAGIRQRPLTGHTHSACMRTHPGQEKSRLCQLAN
jgi:hypothetical protein